MTSRWLPTWRGSTACSWPAEPRRAAGARISPERPVARPHTTEEESEPRMSIETATLDRTLGRASGAATICDCCSAYQPARNVTARHRGTDVRLVLCEPCFRQNVFVERGHSAAMTRATEAAYAVQTRTRRDTCRTPSPNWRAQTAALRRQTEALRRRPASHSQHGRRAAAR